MNYLIYKIFSEIINGLVFNKNFLSSLLLCVMKSVKIEPKFACAVFNSSLSFRAL